MFSIEYVQDIIYPSNEVLIVKANAEQDHNIPSVLISYDPFFWNWTFVGVEQDGRQTFSLWQNYKLKHFPSQPEERTQQQQQLCFMI